MVYIQLYKVFQVLWVQDFYCTLCLSILTDIIWAWPNKLRKHFFLLFESLTMNIEWYRCWSLFLLSCSNASSISFNLWLFFIFFRNLFRLVHSCNSCSIHSYLSVVMLVGCIIVNFTWWFVKCWLDGVVICRSRCLEHLLLL